MAASAETSTKRLRPAAGDGKAVSDTRAVVTGCRPPSVAFARGGLRLITSLVAIGVGLVALSGLSGFRLPSLGAGLWIADLIGWAAHMLLVVMLLLPVRPSRSAKLPVLGHRIHRYAGYGVLVLCFTHTVTVLLAEPHSVQYLSPGAPIYMLTGLAAAALLIFLCVTSRALVRTRLYRHPAAFRYDHLLMALFVLVLALGHALGSGSIPFTAWRAAPWAAVSALAALSLRQRQRAARRWDA